jgi:hypothetical protein
MAMMKMNETFTGLAMLIFVPCLTANCNVPNSVQRSTQQADQLAKG